MNKVLFTLISLLLLILFLPQIAFASSSYVLPYPSAMPGSVFYKLGLVREEIMKYWYYGDFGQFEYNLKQSDKYLVEAKTLFDYNQYLLGFEALLRSDEFFKKIKPNLISAENHKKVITDKSLILSSAAEKHIEELVKIKNSVPKIFIWSPEKSNPTTLMLWKVIDNSISLRNNTL